MAVSDAVAAELRRMGVTNVFGLIGSGNFRVANAIAEAGIEFHSSRHEEGAVCMADVYARCARTVGICSLHQGPGLTNCLTSLTEAVKAHTPVLILAAAIADDRDANSWIDQASVVKSLGAVAEWVTVPSAAAADVARAFDRAWTEKRVVVLMIPVDVERAEYAAGEEVARESPRAVRTASSDAPISEARELLREAERPLILAGRGAVLADAGRPLMELGARTGALLATSAQAWGLFAEDQFDLGISGGFSTPVTTRLVKEADLIVAFGASLNPWTTRRGTLFGPDVRIVQVDCDKKAIGQHQDVDLAVVGDAAEIAQLLITTCDGVVDDRKRGRRSPELAEEIRASRWRYLPYEDTGTEDFLDPRTLTIVLDDLIPRNRVIVPDSGHFMAYPIKYMDVPDASGFAFSQAYMAIGLGLPSALGASIAHPERAVVATLGDGGALMLLSEFETLARLDRRVLVVIYNDAGYGAEVHRFRPLGLDVDLVRFPDTDFAAIGRALGIQSITARSREDLEPVRDWAGANSGPMLVDAKINPDLRDAWMDEIPEPRKQGSAPG